MFDPPEVAFCWNHSGPLNPDTLKPSCNDVASFVKRNGFSL